MARLSNRQPVPIYAHLALRVRAGGPGAQCTLVTLQNRLGRLVDRVSQRLKDRDESTNIVHIALDDTIIGPPLVEPMWPNAFFVGHVRTRANKLANAALAQREGLPLDFVAMRPFLRRVIDRLAREMEHVPSVDDVLADPSVTKRRKPVPPAYVAWLLDERGSRLVRLDTSEHAFDDALGGWARDCAPSRRFPILAWPPPVGTTTPGCLWSLCYRKKATRLRRSRRSSAAPSRRCSTTASPGGACRGSTWLPNGRALPHRGKPFAPSTENRTRRSWMRLPSARRTAKASTASPARLPMPAFLCR